MIRQRIDAATTLAERWPAIADLARLRPSMFVGDAGTAHERAISITLDLLATTKVFPGLRSVYLACSPTRFRIASYSRPMTPTIERHVDWQQPVLIEGFRRLREFLMRDPATKKNWKRVLVSSTGPNLEMVMWPALLAERYSIWLRTDSGYWHQSFNNGMPIAKPALADSDGTAGLVIHAQLPHEWFTGLPYTEALMQRLIPSTLVGVTTLVWHQSDGSLPDARQFTEHAIVG
jgi:hypothetical protein